VAEGKRDEAKAAMAAVAAAAAGAAAAAAAAAVAAEDAAVKTLTTNGNLVKSAADSIAIILGKAAAPPIIFQQSDIKQKTKDLLEQLLTEMEQKIKEDIKQNNEFTRDSEIERDELDKLKQAADAIQSPPQELNKNIEYLETLLQNVNEDIGRLNTISATLQTETTDLINEIRQDIGNITQSTTQINQGTFENIKTKSERLTQQYNEIKEETKELKETLNKITENYTLKLEDTKIQVIDGIRQRLTAIIGTLNDPPTDPDGARLIRDINTLLASVDG